MKIALNARYQGRVMTGVERYASEITRRLPLDFTLLAPSRNVQGMRGHVWEQTLLPLKFRDDVLWSPCNTGPIAVRRQVVTIHDCAFLDHPEHFSRAFARWYGWLMPQLARCVAKIITVSEFSKSRLVHRLGLPPEKVEVIANGVDDRFCPQSPERAEAVRDKYQLPHRYVLSVGSLEPRKNLAQLLRAWQQVAADHPGVTLVVVGATNLRAFRDVKFDTQLSRVLFLGYVEYQDLPAIYSSAELFVYPSLYEGFGLPVLEAMACGSPVICSFATSLPEVAGCAAEYVDPTQSESLITTIRSLLDNASRQAELREASLSRARCFSWDQAAKQTHRVLAAVAEGGGA